MWNSSVKMFLEEEGPAEAQSDYAFSILKTSGSPDSWTPGNVKVPGIYSEGRLSAEKLYKFKQIGVDRQRSFLRAQDFYMDLRYLENDSLVNYSETGLRVFTGPELASQDRFPDNNSVYVNKDIAVLEENGKRVKLRYYSWQS
jgi:hypothetical protein